MKHWLLKTEPEAFSWWDLVRKGREHWDGVRNYQARNNLAAMAVGDLALFYHSVEAKQVVGIARVARAHYPDPTTDDPRWVVVDVEPARGLRCPVTLAAMKADAALAGMLMLRQSRLSVVPLTPEQFHRIVELGGGEIPPGDVPCRPAQVEVGVEGRVPVEMPVETLRKAKRNAPKEKEKRKK